MTCSSRPKMVGLPAPVEAGGEPAHPDGEADGAFPPRPAHTVRHDDSDPRRPVPGARVFAAARTGLPLRTSVPRGARIRLPGPAPSTPPAARSRTRVPAGG